MPYVAASDLRLPPYNLSEDVAPDNVVETAIALWQQAIDRVTRQFFEPRFGTLDLDGTNSDTIHLAIPIVEVDALFLNSGFSEPLDPSYYRVYNRRDGLEDDRRNPRIKLVGPDVTRDIYSQPMVYGRLIFRKGRQNQRIVGTFGYVEEDLSTPLPIRHALAKLVIEKLTRPVLEDPENPMPSNPVVGPLIEEETDDHRQRWAILGGQTRARAPGLTGITQDREILDILQLYRAPLGLASPSSWTPG